jgi:Core-2/I-Branching enzyme
MKIAFLVLSHRPPGQLVRLLSALRSQLPDAPIVVHHDVYREELPSAEVEHISDVHLLASRGPVGWGDFSLVDAYCWSLAWMIKHVDFDWVVMLSAQDYPIKPLSGLAEDLASDGADAVIGAMPVGLLSTAAVRRDMHRRYSYQYRQAAVRPRGSWLPDHLRHALRRGTGHLIDVVNIIQPFFKIYRFPDLIPYRFGWRARNAPFDRRHPCWYGSMWFGMSWEAAEYVMNYMADYPEFVDYYSKTIIPDESMIATLLFNSPQLRVSSRELHYTRWSRTKSGHPDVFGAADLDDLLTAPQYFARKFDIAADAEILDKLDEVIRLDKLIG